MKTQSSNIISKVVLRLTEYLCQKVQINYFNCLYPQNLLGLYRIYFSSELVLPSRYFTFPSIFTGNYFILMLPWPNGLTFNLFYGYPELKHIFFSSQKAHLKYLFLYRNILVLLRKIIFLEKSKIGPLPNILQSCWNLFVLLSVNLNRGKITASDLIHIKYQTMESSSNV